MTRGTNTNSARPRGLISWARRRIFPRLARYLALLGVLVLVAWVIGRVRTDQTRWSQYLWWLPPLWALGAAWLLLFVSAGFGWLSRRPSGWVLRPLLLVGCVALSVYVLVWSWHLPRFARSYTRDPSSIRVLHWNQSAARIDQQQWGRRIRDLGVDIVLIANAKWGDDRQRLLSQFEYFAPVEQERWVNYSYRVHAEPSHYRVEGDAMIASRFPMTRTGMVSFGSRQRQQVLNHSSSGKGWVMFAEFDLDPDDPQDEPFVVWFVDLPSNPLHWKIEQMQGVRRAIDSWEGIGWEMGRHVWEQTQFEDTRFPTPDLIIGDFNTTRGSASLDLLVPDYQDAFEAVGMGRGRSWVPESRNRIQRAAFKLADFHIDLALLNPAARAEHYELLETEHGSHYVQILDLSRDSGTITEN